MSIQNSFNSALSIASLLWSQSGKVSEVKEARKVEKLGKEFEAKRDAIIRSAVGESPESDDAVERVERDAKLYEETGRVYREEFEATNSLDALQNAKAFEQQSGIFRKQAATYRERQQAKADQDRQAAERIRTENEERERIRQMILSGGIDNG